MGRALREVSSRLLSRVVAPLLARAARCSGRRAGLALVYHGVAAAPGDRAREIVPAHGRDLFEAQARHLAACYRVVPAPELLPAAAARRRGERFPVSITFDDDLAAHHRVALPVLRRLGLPATFFLSGASLLAPHAFWWQRLQAGVDADVPVVDLLPSEARSTLAPDRASIHELAAVIDDLPRDEREALAERLRVELGEEPSDLSLDEDGVRALVAAGAEIGFHTLRHDHLPRLDDDELVRAMTEGRDRLAQIAGRRLLTIAYPHGDADRRVVAAARAAGYTTGFTTLPVPVLPGDDRLLLGRIEPSFVSAGRFALRLVIALLRRRSISPQERYA
jgi:peptidoglycan/xylan/chitin deacetylase (PgdA/CDA1 family)